MSLCVLCGEVIEGWGNNPFPLAEEGECCDSCNNDVIIARLDGMNMPKLWINQFEKEKVNEQ